VVDRVQLCLTNGESSQCELCVYVCVCVCVYVQLSRQSAVVPNEWQKQFGVSCVCVCVCVCVCSIVDRMRSCLLSGGSI